MLSRKHMLVISFAFIVTEIIVGLIALTFLPDKIPMQWSGLTVVWEAPKAAILAWPALSLLLSFFFIQANHSTPGSRDFWMAVLFLFIMTMFLSSQLYTIAFSCFAVRFPVMYMLVGETLTFLLGSNAVYYSIKRKYKTK